MVSHYNPSVAVALKRGIGRISPDTLLGKPMTNDEQAASLLYAHEPKGDWRVVKARTAVSSTKLVIAFSGDFPPAYLHRFALVGKGDRVRQEKNRWLVNPRKSQDEVQISPAWQTCHRLPVCGRRMEIIVKEIETPEEMEGYQFLTRCHYRDGGGVARRAPLIAKLTAADLPEVVGFVELSSCFLVNVPRKKILNQPFADDERKVEWKKWDMDTASKYTNVVVRISRCVVFPELRGIGLAPLLTGAAVDFARERWHLGGLRPCFMEITAEMLRYWPFAEKCGFVKVGETEGNEKRLPEAMTYLLGRVKEKGYPKGGGGIMSMHRAHADLLTRFMEKRAISSVKELIARIDKKSLSIDDWIFLHKIYRHPKPTYMIGLTDAAKNHLRRHAPRKPRRSVALRIDKTVINLQNIKISASSRPARSQGARKIQEAFGIVTKEFAVDIIKGLDFHLCDSEIILVTGPSGTGKSALLRAMARFTCGKYKRFGFPAGIKVRCTSSSFSPLKISTLIKPNRNKSAIELMMARGLSVEESLRVLASGGLAEAQLFVRPARTLSVGQNYRLSVALALAREPDILVLDDFCESLDRFSAAAVCRRLRKATAQGSLAAVVATADPSRIRSELRPDKILMLLPGGRFKWMHNSKASR